MNLIYVLLFRADTGCFVNAIFARSNEHAAGFAEGVQTATKRRRVYIWPKERLHANHEESVEQMTRANRAIKKDMARREQDIAAPKATDEVSCDECQAQVGEWCLRRVGDKWLWRREGFHASRIATAKAAT
jgi:hypothetical protein